MSDPTVGFINALSDPARIPDPLTAPPPPPPAPVQRLDHNFTPIIEAELTRDQRIRLNALDLAVKSLPPSYGQTDTTLHIAATYEYYIRTGGTPA